MKLILISSLILILIGCSYNTQLDRSEKQALLRTHLAEWQEFTADGILEANFKNFAFRKNININKKSDLWKITIFDSGIFGMKPQPFLIIEIDSLISVQDQIGPAEIYRPQNPIILNLIHDPLLLLEYEQEILSQKSITIFETVQISFSREMRIIEIKVLQSGYRIEFDYQEKLKSVMIFEDSNELAKIQIDKIVS